MRLTKSQLKQIIKEELGKTFPLEEQPDISPTSGKPATAPAPTAKIKQSTAVEKVAIRLDKIPGLDKLLAKINKRVYLIELLSDILERVPVESNDKILSLKAVAQKLGVEL